MNKQPFTHFDLPREHLGNGIHYVPPKARDPREIERRKRGPAGALLLEKQYQGLRAANLILRQTDAEDLRYSAEVISKAALNSSWYTFARSAPDVMRRRLYLPQMFDEITEQKVTTQELKEQTIGMLNSATEGAYDLLLRREARRDAKRQTAAFGRSIGSAALRLSVLGSESVPGGNPFDTQYAVRLRALQTLDDSRRLEVGGGAYASFAQLADPDSPLSVQWRREAPQAAYEALVEAHDVLDFKLFSE